MSGLSRRNFIGTGATIIAGSILVTNPQITGAELNDNGVLVPTQQEVLIATKLPSKITKGGFEMWLTRMNVEIGPLINMTTIENGVNKYIESPNSMDINIRGSLTGPTDLQILVQEMLGKKIKVHFTLE